MHAGRVSVQQAVAAQRAAESVRKQLERRLDELNGPAPSAPPPSAAAATMLMFIEMMKMRQQNLREEIRRLQEKLAALQTQYVALLAKL
jgi:prefoldin subunit 5